MPVYGYGTIGAPWSVCKEMEKKKLNKLLMIFKKVESEFKLNEVFLHSIIYNTKLESCYIAKYDMSKTNIDTYVYQSMLEKMVETANLILSKNKGFKDYKFDISGTWTIGKVIIMKKNY